MKTEHCYGARGRKRQRGAFLLDAMMSIAVASTMLLYGLSLMMTTASSADAAKQTTVAYNAARQAIENVRSYRGAVLRNGTYDAEALGAMPQITEFNHGTGTVVVESFRDPVKKVTVLISWHTGGRPAYRSISIVSLVTPGGVTP